MQRRLMTRQQKMKVFETGGLVLLGGMVSLGLTLAVNGALHLFAPAFQGLAKMNTASSNVMPLAAASAAAPATAGALVFAGVKGLELQIDNGDITITRATDGRASLEWTVQASHSARAAAADTLEVAAELDGGTLIIHDQYSGGEHLDRPSVALTLSLPPNSDIEAALGNGKLNINADGQLEANVGNGTLTLAGSCPAAEASVGNGKLQTDWLLGGGDYDLSVGNGDIELGLLNGSNCSFDATTGMGSIDLNGVPGQLSKTSTSQSASGSVGEGKGNVKLSVGLGSIKFNPTADGPAAAKGA